MATVFRIPGGQWLAVGCDIKTETTGLRLETVVVVGQVSDQEVGSLSFPFTAGWCCSFQSS